MALPMNVSGLRRNIKNIAHNYTDAQVKVREATSNDPWGPSSTIMSEIADLTYNVVAFSEIMQMVWKRLNDHGKNWRHVYKALVLLEYLIKTGSEKVAEQSRENIHSISTLKDFQYIEEGKDQGINVREKAKAMVTLLKDDERLRNERVRALKAKERFAQSVSGIASDADINSPTSPSYHDTFVTSSSRSEREAYGVRERPTDYGELESARPHTLGEEELQLQLALAMSKEEADHEEARRRSDDVRLQMALSESKDEKPGDEPLFDGRASPSGSRDRQSRKEKDQRSGINDLLDINFNPPHQQMMDSSGLGAVGGLGLGSPVSPPAPPRDPWGLSPPALTTTNGQADPWSGVSSIGGGGAGAVSLHTSPPTVSAIDAINDPWTPPPPPPQPAVVPPVNDPWAPAPVLPPVDPWSPAPSGAVGKGPSPVVGATPPPPAQHDPFAPLPSSQLPADEFSTLTNREKPSVGDGAFSLSALDGALSSITSPPLNAAARASPTKSRSPAAFLGENSNLVNLDNLVATKGATPYGMEATSALSTSFPNLNALLHTPTTNNNTRNVSSAYPALGLNSSTLALSSNALNASFNSDNLLGINNNHKNFAISSNNPFGSTQATSISYNFNNNSLENFGSLIEGSSSTVQRPYSAVPLSFSLNTSPSSPLPPLSQASFPGANPFSMTGGASAFGGGVNASVGGANAFGSGASGVGGGVNASVGGASVFGAGASGNVPNPFQAAQSPKPSINQLRATTAGSGLGGPWGVPQTNNLSGLDTLSSQHNDPFLL